MTLEEIRAAGASGGFITSPHLSPLLLGRDFVVQKANRE
jgi:hypothetical protein